MLTLLKYLPLLLRGKGIADIYREETGQGKPIYLSRRFVGAVVVVIFAALTTYTGISIDEGLSLQVADNTATIITAVITLYGIILGIVGHFKRQK